MQAQNKSLIDLSPDELARYARHLTLPQIGLTGQKRLKASSVLCVGCGGLGSPLLLYLAAAGVGRIGIIDNDLVEESNLQRQIIHNLNWIGKPKTKSSQAQLIRINPYCQIETFETKLNVNNALDLISKYDLVCDCTDNFPSRYLINDACVLLNKPNIYGSVATFEGQATVFNLKKESPNYRDLLPEEPPVELIPSCEEGGVIGVVPGLIGLIQATEAIKIITGIGEPLDGRLVVFNALDMKFRELKLKKNPDTISIKTLTGSNSTNLEKNDLTSKPKSYSFTQASAKELSKLMRHSPENVTLLDVRTKKEYKVHSIEGSHLFPLEEIAKGKRINEIRRLSKNRRLYVYCKSGIRSIKALKILEEYGIKGSNLAGGIDAWSSEIKQINNNRHDLTS